MNPIEHLYFHARIRPDDTAIQRLSSAITWGALLAEVRGIACKLRQMGVQPGQIVVTWLHSQTDWIVTLALMHEAVATCAALGAFPSELSADFLLTDRALPHFPHPRTIVIDEGWLNDLPQPPEDFGPHAYAGEDSLFRLMLTSGTTGQSKAAELSLGAMMRRAGCTSWPSNLFTTELCVLRLASGLRYLVELRRLLRGLVSYFATADEIVDLISAFKIEHLSGSPRQLAAVIEKLPVGSKRPLSLKMVSYSGGEPTPTLLDNIRRNLCPTVMCDYGSTEVGPVSYYLVHDPNNRHGIVGYVTPEVDVQIVDEQHRALPVGREGAVRLRSAGIANGYFRNPAETARSFRNGWFYPGDRGRLLHNRMLELTGRESEMINLGGTKISPAEIDNSIQGYAGILDVATFGFENQLGYEDICAAVVVADGFDMETFRQYLTRTMPKHKKPAWIIRLHEIPRNQIGKPLRTQMREQFGDFLRQQQRTMGQ